VASIIEGVFTDHGPEYVQALQEAGYDPVDLIYDPSGNWPDLSGYDLVLVDFSDNWWGTSWSTADEDVLAGYIDGAGGCVWVIGQDYLYFRGTAIGFPMDYLGVCDYADDCGWSGGTLRGCPGGPMEGFQGGVTDTQFWDELWPCTQCLLELEDWQSGSTIAVGTVGNGALFLAGEAANSPELLHAVAATYCPTSLPDGRFGDLFAWRRALGRSVRIGADLCGSTDAVLLVGAEHDVPEAGYRLVSVDLGTGEPIWRAHVPADVDTRALLWDPSGSQIVVAANPPSGTEARLLCLGLTDPSQEPGLRWEVSVFAEEYDTRGFEVVDLVVPSSSTDPMPYVLAADDDLMGYALLAHLDPLSGQPMSLWQWSAIAGRVHLRALSAEVPDPATGGYLMAGDVDSAGVSVSPWVAYVRPNGDWQWATALVSGSSPLALTPVDVGVWQTGELPWTVVLLCASPDGEGTYLVRLDGWGGLVDHVGLTPEVGVFTPRALEVTPDGVAIVCGGFRDAYAAFEEPAAMAVRLAAPMEPLWFRRLERAIEGWAQEVFCEPDGRILLAGESDRRPFLLELAADGTSGECPIWRDVAVPVFAHQLALSAVGPVLQSEPAVPGFLPRALSVTVYPGAEVSDLCVPVADVGEPGAAFPPGRVCVLPRTGGLRLRFPGDGPWQVTLWDVTGRRVAHGSFQGRRGWLRLPGVATGILLGTARGPNAEDRFKVVLLK
jgi:hypothetical protein